MLELKFMFQRADPNLGDGRRGDDRVDLVNDMWLSFQVYSLSYSAPSPLIHLTMLGTLPTFSRSLAY